MKKDYSHTLLMPKTNFEMRGNLTSKDSYYINFWNEKRIYEKLSTRNTDNFILHDGPPYANGSIHIGHAFNKILKDFIIRDAALRNKKIEWVFGWDTHGLPIELQIQKEGIKFSEVGITKYLLECEKYAMNQVKLQQDQFLKLGLLSNPQKQKYLTLDNNFMVKEIEIFFSFLNQKLAYQSRKPVYWSWSSETALAEAEVEYKTIKDDAIYINFKYKNELNILIWTTTPWTLPGNVALAFSKKTKYIIVEIDKIKTIIAKDLLDFLSKKINKKIDFIEEIELEKLIGTKAINPINGNESKLIYGEHVNTTSGTGIVHISGGHGVDDYKSVLENDLNLFIVMDDKGHMINSGEYNGLFYLKANKLIIENNSSSIVYLEKYEHSVPIDWRTKNFVVYRATKQWFISINSIKEELLSEIKNVEWVPSWGEKKMSDMTNDRQDWCISRQRLWGVPIPIIYDENNIPIISKELQRNILNLFSKKGIQGWHEINIKDILPKSIIYNSKMKKERDILDVWFDSGSSHSLISNNQKSDIYIEGNDQYRGWFSSSLITSVILKKQSPYKKVITHGFVTDKKGNKMSKSIGNVISPLEITEKYGLDILRLLIANLDYTDNVKIYDDLIKQISTDYRKIRNTIKFILGVISDFDEDEIDNISNFSKLILGDISESYNKNLYNLKNQNFNQVIKEVMRLITNGSISYFLEYSKDIVYVYFKNDKKRIEVQYVIRKILDYVLYSLSPIIPVTIEEAYSELNKETSIYETIYPTLQKYKSNWNEFNVLREKINKQIEKLRQEKMITKSQEVNLEFKFPEFLKNLGNNLSEILMVSTINDSDNTNVIAKKTKNIMCQRCWKYNIQNDIISKELICKKCENVINTQKLKK